jgi:hypothetical protein
MKGCYVYFMDTAGPAVFRCGSRRSVSATRTDRSFAPLAELRASAPD